ncbi:hypothetical protein DRO42_02865, partial [Candidatus Bathyarchaeota archaeon]
PSARSAWRWAPSTPTWRTPRPGSSSSGRPGSASSTPTRRSGRSTRWTSASPGAGYPTTSRGLRRWRETLEAVIGELIEVGLSLGGTISGEHGVGYTKKRYLPKQVGRTQVELMKAIKRAFDPQNILNPGKVFDL